MAVAAEGAVIRLSKLTRAEFSPRKLRGVFLRGCIGVEEGLERVVERRSSVIADTSNGSEPPLTGLLFRLLSSANSSVGVFRLGGRDQGSLEATDGGGTEAGVGETLTGAHGSAGLGVGAVRPLIAGAQGSAGGIAAGQLQGSVWGLETVGRAGACVLGRGVPQGSVLGPTAPNVSTSKRSSM